MAKNNKIFIMGNMAADPELKTTSTGKNVTTFSVAVQRETADKTADFFTVVAWEKSAEYLSKYGGKGKRVIVWGRLQTRSWTTNSGEKRYATEIMCDECTVINYGNTPNAPVVNEPPKFEDVPDDDDLPF